MLRFKAIYCVLARKLKRYFPVRGKVFQALELEHLS